MPDDEAAAPGSWTDKAKAVAIIIGAVCVGAPSIVSAVYSVRNHGRTDTIETSVQAIQEKQAVNADNIAKGVKAAERTEKAALKIQAAVME